MEKTWGETEQQKWYQELGFWSDIKLEMALVLPSCYSKQADSYISLGFKRGIWVRAIISGVSTVQTALKVMGLKPTTLSIFTRDPKRRDSKSEPWSMTKEMIEGQGRISKGDCEVVVHEIKQKPCESTYGNKENILGSKFTICVKHC